MPQNISSARVALDVGIPWYSDAAMRFQMATVSSNDGHPSNIQKA